MTPVKYARPVESPTGVRSAQFNRASCPYRAPVKQKKQKVSQGKNFTGQAND